MTIDIHEKIGKLPIIPKRGFTLPNMRLLWTIQSIRKTTNL